MLGIVIALVLLMLTERNLAMNTMMTATNNLNAYRDLESMKADFLSCIQGSERTKESYVKALRRFMEWLNNNGVTNPNRNTIVTYAKELKGAYKPNTVNAYLGVVRLFFSWLASNGLYPDIAANVKGAKTSRTFKKDYLTATQAKRVLEMIETSTPEGVRAKAITALAITTGLRVIEIARANREDLRSKGNKIVLYIQGKGREDRSEFVIVPDSVETLIREWLTLAPCKDEVSPLFQSLSNNNKGGRLSTRAISGDIKKRFKAAGYDSERLTAHSTRHTAITLSLLNGQTLEQAQQFARHQNIATTQIYAHHLNALENECSTTVADAIL